VNNTLSKLTLLVNKYFPLIITNISMQEGELSAKAYGGKRMVGRIKTSAKNRLAAQTEIEDIVNLSEQREAYASFKNRFPGSGFSPTPKYDTEELFLDFFTRIAFYGGFKLLETVKDSKMDYQRSIRTLGKLKVEESRFRVNYSEDHVNASISRFVSNEFPWMVNNKFLFDVIGLKVQFMDKGHIGFSGHIGLGYSETGKAEPKGAEISGIGNIEIDEASQLPRFVFKSIELNDKPYPVDKLNIVTARLLELLTDARIPLKLEEIKISKGRIIMKGEAARDYSARVFSDPYLFVIFHIRKWDVGMAGIERLRIPLSTEYEGYRGRTYEKGGYGFERVYKPSRQ
jgi:hypothetical protein